MTDFLHWVPALLVPSFWILVSILSSRISGWSLLAKAYLQGSNTLDGETWRFQSIQMRWATNYGNCVTVRANPMGLGFSVLFLMRIGHPALLVPWSEISIHNVRKSWYLPSLMEFRFRSVPSVPVRVNKKLFSKIMDASDRYYPEFRRISPPLDPRRVK